ncbi:MAG: hypothetical protein J6B93_02355 [Clostridia bacterium]|nr:hypothetical protein [Clostridia bacterium]
MGIYNHEVATFRDNDKVITMKTLALPLILQSLIVNLIDTTGVLVLSGYSDSVVAATSVSNQITNLPQNILNTIATGTVILTSIALGEKKKEKAANISGCGILLALFLSLVTAVAVSLWSDGLTRLMALTGDTQKKAAVFLAIKVFSMPIITVRGVLQQLLICSGHSNEVLVSGTVTGALNAGLSYVVLYMVKLPCDEMTALALKTIVAWIVGFTITLFFFIRHRCPVSLHFNFGISGRILRLGLPAGMCVISYNLSTTITTGFLASMGETALNTKIYIGNIVTYVPIIGFALAGATSVFMGRHRGAKNFEAMKILFRQNLYTTLAINLILSVLVFILQRPLLSLFTRDAEIFKMAWLVFLLDIPLELARGINNHSENCLNPNGDVKTTLTVSVIAGWLFSVALGYILCVGCNMGIIGLWIGFLCNEWCKVVVYLVRWRSGRWQNTKI